MTYDHYLQALIGNRIGITARGINVITTNQNDIDASTPTLKIDSFKKNIRLNRPISPHLTIYKPQMTWILSAAHRITGAGIGALFYFVAMTYAIIPIDSTVLATYVGSYPTLVLILAKAIIGFPLFFHSFNGIRHLIWDTASSLTLKRVYSSAYVCLGASTLATVLFALFY